MKAVVYNKKTPGKLVFTEVEKPIPNADEVLVKIIAASVNAADYRSMRMGIIPRKKIFGADIAGTVESVGANIHKFKPGDQVYGDLASFGFGGFAEYAVTPEKALALKPAKLSFEEAAALPLAAVTALQAVRNLGNLQKGQKVLIVGSGGGVGTYAIQLAKYFDAKVTAVCSSQNAELAKSLGTDHVIDYTKDDFTKNKLRYDLILAVNGNYLLSAYKRLLNPDGIYVMIGGALPQVFKSLLFGWLFSFGSRKMRSLAAKASQADLEFIAKLADDGHIKPVIDQRFPLEKTADAMRYLNAGHAQGKVVIQISGER